MGWQVWEGYKRKGIQQAAGQTKVRPHILSYSTTPTHSTQHQQAVVSGHVTFDQRSNEFDAAKRRITRFGTEIRIPCCEYPHEHPMFTSHCPGRRGQLSRLKFKFAYLVQIQLAIESFPLCQMTFGCFCEAAFVRIAFFNAANQAILYFPNRNCSQYKLYVGFYTNR
jgi:hypothetical protein